MHWALGTRHNEHDQHGQAVVWRVDIAVLPATSRLHFARRFGAWLLAPASTPYRFSDLIDPWSAG